MDVMFLLAAFLLIAARRGLSQLHSAPDGFQDSNLSVGLVSQTSEKTGAEQFAKSSDSSWNTGSNVFLPKKLNNGKEKPYLKSQANENKPTAIKLMSPEIKTNSGKIQSKSLKSAHKGAYIEPADILNLKVSDIIGINPNERLLDLNMASSPENFYSKNADEDKHTREKSKKKLHGQTDIDKSTDSTDAIVNRNINNDLVTYHGKLNSERKHVLLKQISKSNDKNVVDKQGQNMMSKENKVAVPKEKKLSDLSDTGLLNSKLIKTVSGSVRIYGGSTVSSSGTRNDKTVDLNNNAVLESVKLSTNMYEVKDAGISIEKTNSKSPSINLNNNVKDLNNILDAPFTTDIRQKNDKNKITEENSGKYFDEATFSVYDKTDGFETIKIKQPDSSSVLYSNEANVDKNNDFTNKVPAEIIGASSSEMFSSIGTPKGTIRQKDDSTSTAGLSSKSLEGNKDEQKSDTPLEISILKDKQFVRQPQTMSELIRLFGIDAKLVQNLFTEEVKNAKNVSDISNSNMDGLGITEYKHSPPESDRSVKGDYHTHKKQESSGNEIHLLNNLNNEPLKKLKTETNNSPDGFPNVSAFIPYLAELNKGTIGTVSTVNDKPEKQSAKDVNVVVRIRGLNALPSPAQGVSDGFNLDGKTDIQTPKYVYINERKTGHIPSKSSKQVYKSTDGFINHDSFDSVINTIISGKEGVDGFINIGNLDSNTVDSENSQNFIDPRKLPSSAKRHYSTLTNENIVHRHASSDLDRGQHSEVNFSTNGLLTTPGAEVRAASSIERNLYSSGSLNGLGRYPVVHTQIDSDDRRRSAEVVLRQSDSMVDFSRENALNSASSREEMGSDFRNSFSHGSFREALPAQRGDAITMEGSSRPDILHRSGVYVPFRRGFSASGPTFRRDFSRVSGPRFGERTYPLRFRTPSLPSDGRRFTGMYSASPSTLYRSGPYRFPPGGFMGRRFPLPGAPPGVRPFTPAMTPMPFRFF